MIRIQSLSKTYQVPGGTVDALKGIDLEIQKGEIFGIIGMSGAGKSTLIRCMNLLERPTSGSIEIDGQDVTGLSNKALRQMRHSVGMIFQQFFNRFTAALFHRIYNFFLCLYRFYTTKKCTCSEEQAH